MLHNGHIRLRKVEPSDLAFLYIVENDARSWNDSNTHNPLSQKDLQDYIASSTGDIYQDGQLRLLITDAEGERTWGVCDLFDFEPRAGKAALGLYILPEARGQHIAEEAVQLIEEYAFTFLHLSQLYAVISVTNTSCMRLFERMQYQASASLRCWDGANDAVVWQKLAPTYSQAQVKHTRCVDKVARVSIVFIGAGRLATHLATALQAAGHDIVQVFSRTQASAQALAQRLQLPKDKAITSLNDLMTDADVYIYALRDEVLPDIIRQVHVQKNALHLHTSGSMPLSVFDMRSSDAVPNTECSENFHKPSAYAVFYPFQSFSKEKEVDFQRIPILIEGSTPQATRAAEALARSISRCVYVADEASRKRLHVAGVLANNFVNCLYALAEEQLSDTPLPFEVLLPLIDETAAKVHSLSPREAQTGPAIRHDKQVMAAQEVLLEDADLQRLYQWFSQNIEDHAK